MLKVVWVKMFHAYEFRLKFLVGGMVKSEIYKSW